MTLSHQVWCSNGCVRHGGSCLDLPDTDGSSDMVCDCLWLFVLLSKSEMRMTKTETKNIQKETEIPRKMEVGFQWSWTRKTSQDPGFLSEAGLLKQCGSSYTTQYTTHAQECPRSPKSQKNLKKVSQVLWRSICRSMQWVGRLPGRRRRESRTRPAWGHGTGTRSLCRKCQVCQVCIWSYLIISDPVGSCWVMLGHVSSSTEWNIMLHPFAWLLGLLGMLLGQLFYSVRDLASLESNKVWPAHFPLQRSKGFHSGTQMDNTACHSLWIRSPWSLQVFAEVRCGGACCRPINSFHRDKHHSFTPLTWPCCIWKVVPTGTCHAVLQEHIRHSRVRFASKETNRELFNSTMAKNQTGALNWNYF